jgi:PAS domain S-box-containing protein
MVDSSQDAIVGLGLDGNVMTWNAGAERVYGRRADVALGLSASELWVPEVRAKLDAELARVARGEHVEIADATGMRADGTRVELLVTLSPVRDADGDVVALSLIAHDVTHRRRAQQALRRSESRFRVLADSGVLSIAFVDAEGRILDANAAFLALVGQDREGIARGVRRLMELSAAEAEMAALLRELWVSGRCAPREVQCVRRDGTRLTCLVAGGRLDGGVEGVVVLLDITERRRALVELEQSEGRLRLALEATKLGIWELDPTTGVFRASPRAREIWALEPDEPVTYDNRLAHVHPDDRDRVEGAVQRALDPRGDGECRVTYRTCLTDDQVRWVEANGRAVFSETGGYRRPTRFIGALLDVTERRASEEALREADRRKDRFLAMLSHELRNPLAAIRSAAYIVGQLGDGSRSLQRSRAIVERQVEHMTHLLDDLLDVGRLANGRVSLHKERLDLVALVRTAVDDHRAEADAAGVTLTASLPADPIWLLADPTRIGQSVTNLLVNALKFTPKGGNAAVSVTHDPSEGLCTVTVTDDGIGVEAEMLPHLFEPFSQADRTLDRSRGGLGLGLSLVKSFVEMHDGFVSASSEGAGRGATFGMTLPVQGEAPSDRPVSAPAPGSLRVLVIEDNIDAAESIAMLLELSGHEVAVAHDGPEGLARARELLPMVVLCDIGLPGAMDGYAVARALRAEPGSKEARLVALSGYGQEDDKRRSLEAGFDAHVTKPVGADALRRILAR